MKAIALTTYGGPGVLHLVELPEPHAGPGEVRIRVYAAAVNPADILIRSGAAAALLRQPAPHIPGLDAAGVIDEVGKNVPARLKPGDRVVAMVNPTRPAGGAYAELLVLPADYVALAPARAGHAEASTLPANALTARVALDRLALRAGQTIAVTGAAGAVGGYAVQLARADGLRVIGDAAPADTALVRGLGADVVVARGPGVAQRIRAAEPAGVDAVIDAAAIGAALLPAVRDHGIVAIIRGGTPPGAGSCSTSATAAVSGMTAQGVPAAAAYRVLKVVTHERGHDRPRSGCTPRSRRKNTRPGQRSSAPTLRSGTGW